MRRVIYQLRLLFLEARYKVKFLMLDAKEWLIKRKLKKIIKPIFERPWVSDDAEFAQRLWNLIGEKQGRHTYEVGGGKLQSLKADMTLPFAIVVVNHDNGEITECADGAVKVRNMFHGV